MAASWVELAVVALPLVRELFLWLRERSQRRSAERLAQQAQPSIGISCAEREGRGGARVPSSELSLSGPGSKSRCARQAEAAIARRLTGAAMTSKRALERPLREEGVASNRVARYQA
jgi:hypothetical protein